MGRVSMYAVVVVNFLHDNAGEYAKRTRPFRWGMAWVMKTYGEESGISGWSSR